MATLREVAGRLQSKVKQTTRAINQLHNLTARTFPELAPLAEDLAAGWVLKLLARYPTAERVASAHPASLEKIPHLCGEKAQAVHEAAKRSVASLRGESAEALVREHVAQVRHCQAAELHLRHLLVAAFADLPDSPHARILTIPGIGDATAAALVAKVVDIDRFETPDHLVGYLGVFPEESSSGVDKRGRPLPAGTLTMCRKGNDLVRAYLWNAARAPPGTTPPSAPSTAGSWPRASAATSRSATACGSCSTSSTPCGRAIGTSTRTTSRGRGRPMPGRQRRLRPPA